MKRLSPLFEIEKDVVKTVDTVEVGHHTYYIDEMKKGGYAVSMDETPLGWFDTIIEAKNWIKI